MKLSDDELLALIEHEERQALGYVSGDLSQDRSDNMEYYLGNKFGEIQGVEGRSSVVSTDVQEAIESVIPSLMKVFAGGDEICRFDPVGPEDVESAEQESEYVNHIAMNQNNGYLVMYNWFKDALINKNAYVKYYWDDSEQTTQETYQGLTDEEFAMLLQDESVEPIEHSAYPDPSIQTQMQQMMAAAQMGDPQAQQALMQMPMLHDVKIKLKGKVDQVKIICVPPEEVLVSSDSRDINPNSVQFFEHRSYKTISEIREMGYDIEDTIADDDPLFQAQEWNARTEFAEEFQGINDEQGPNRRVVYREIYYNVDFDGDGISERRMICVIGKEILANEQVDDVPFACITPFIMPHKHYGRALADLIKDIQVIKTTVMRNILDNFYHANNSRYAISDRVNLDDMLVSRPGGVVRVNGEPAGAIMPLTAQAIGQAAFPLIEYLDSVKENRSGVTRYNQGMDANSLNKTALGISQIMSASQMRLELIARTFAETGVKALFLGIHKLVLQHSKKPQIVRLRNKWVPVDPRQWKTRTDMTVTVGLGTGNKDAQLSHLMNILNVMERAFPLGVATPKNIYEACVELTKNAGFKDADKFWTDPSSQPQKSPQPSPEQIKAQQDAQQHQAEMQQRQQEMQAEMQMEQQKMQMQAMLDAERSRMESMLEQQRMAAEQQTKIILAHIDRVTKLETAEISANTSLTSQQITAAQTAGSSDGS